MFQIQPSFGRCRDVNGWASDFFHAVHMAVESALEDGSNHEIYDGPRRVVDIHVNCLGCRVYIFHPTESKEIRYDVRDFNLSYFNSDKLGGRVDWSFVGIYYTE